MELFFVASECAPYVQVGGLADVVSSLSEAIANNDKSVHISVFIPYYSSIIPKSFQIQELKESYEVASMQHLGEKFSSGRFLKLDSQHQNLTFYFISNEYYFNRKGVYGEKESYDDNHLRFAFFSHSIFEWCKSHHLPDIIHCHDWHTGLIPALLKTVYQQQITYQNIKTCFSIHNLAYQGSYRSNILKDIGVSTLTDNTDVNWERKFLSDGQVNFLSLGIQYSDQVLTVSPRYAHEISTFDAFGYNLKSMLCRLKKPVKGILNGIDRNVWNPSTDKHLVKNFSLTDEDFLQKKQICRQNIIDQLNISETKKTFLSCVISRIDNNKGFDHLFKIFSLSMEKQLDCVFVILGVGDQKISAKLLDFQKKHPRKVVIRLGFDATLCHQFYVASDAILIPSRSEPCGLTQMIALQYGTIPIVNCVGGLRDTIHDACEHDDGNGFIAKQNSTSEICNAFLRAYNFFQDKEKWKSLVKRGGSNTFTWDKFVKEYLQVYSNLLKSDA